jgi:hypothetical protein
MEMISPGLSVGYAAKREAIVAKQNELRRTPSTIGTILTMGVLKISSAATNTTDAIQTL